MRGTPREPLVRLSCRIQLGWSAEGRGSSRRSTVFRLTLHRSHAVSEQIDPQSLTIGARTGGRLCGHKPDRMCDRAAHPIMSDFGRLPPSLLERAESTTGSARARELGDTSPVPLGEDHRPQLQAAETRLLYENANTGVVITSSSPHCWPMRNGMWSRKRSVAGVARLYARRLYRAIRCSRAGIGGRRRPRSTSSRWNAAFVVGTALAAAGWAAAAIALYPSSPPMNEMLVVFVIGGVMLGSASLLAARPEAFLTFLLPTGLVTSWRVASQGDEEHLIMGFLGAVFTVATLITTWRFHLAIDPRSRCDSRTRISSRV